MINPKELRLGNFVSLLDKIVIIRGIDADSVITEAENSEGNPIRYSCNLIMPVFLTSDVLKKCGVLYAERDRFEIALPACEYDETFGNSKQIVFIKRMVRETEGYRLQKIYPPAIRYSIPNAALPIMSLYEHIKSLHQLQNLYYHLAGEELDVNL
ncbi:MAG: hypothetical protein WC756_14515 [Taibaiella sp.]|jgi:hypothetical protein